jgi:hypothetical protein
MRLNVTRLLIAVFLVGIAGHLLGAGDAVAQQSTTKGPRAAVKAAPPAAGAAVACQKQVGILGSYFEAEMTAFLVSNGLTVASVTGASIAGGALSKLDVLYINRAGTADATAQRALIEAWVRGGGVLITEFDATELLFNGSTFNFFSAATLDNGSAVPSGDVCGGNTVNVTSPGNALASGLPASWSCSGDPMGVFKVYKESTLDPILDRVLRVSADQNNDGAKDVAAGTACVGGGAVVAFFSDFGDFQPLQVGRPCPNPPCTRTPQDEALMLNAVCRVKTTCQPLDHFMCYKVRPQRPFKTHKVRVHDQFGDQYLTVVAPDLLCVPSSKKELR